MSSLTEEQAAPKQARATKVELIQEQKAKIERSKPLATDKLAARIAATAALTADSARATAKRNPTGTTATSEHPTGTAGERGGALKPAKQRRVTADLFSNFFAPKLRECRPHSLSHLTR